MNEEREREREKERERERESERERERENVRWLLGLGLPAKIKECAMQWWLQYVYIQQNNCLYVA